MAGPKIRLYVEQPLGEGQAVALEEAAANYLFAVMRLARGDQVHLFNGKDGEWRAEIADANKRRGIAICQEQAVVQGKAPDLWLLFAPVKKERTNFIVEKAVELGAARIMPISTRRMNAERIRQEKQQAHAIEAAEQCDATWVPEVSALTPLERLLADWDPKRRIYWADEARAGQDLIRWPGEIGAASAILIGPEGGFHPDEKSMLDALPFVTPVALGPRILRAETAALAAMTLWQSQFGDWR